MWRINRNRLYYECGPHNLSLFQSVGLLTAKLFRVTPVSKANSPYYQALKT